MRVTGEEQKIIDRLNANWIWVQGWTDSSSYNTAGRLVKFSRHVELDSVPTTANIHVSADTRYKLYVNGKRVAVGPSRSSPDIWYYDTINIAPYLRKGRSDLVFVVVRYFASSRGAMPFERTSFPGLTVHGAIDTDGNTTDISTTEDNWQSEVYENILFPTGLVDDVFLHIYERISPLPPTSVEIKKYGFKTLNGDLLPWRLRPRIIPMPEESPAIISAVRACDSPVPIQQWSTALSQGEAVTLFAGTTSTLELQADVHSTAFLKWSFRASKQSQVNLHITYSEGYELEPRSYPFFRSKMDRLDAENGHLIGPYDAVTLQVPEQKVVTYEPFWFRTFRILRLVIEVGPAPVELMSFEATQINYPLHPVASLEEQSSSPSKDIWELCVRTMRNCMFDGYSDCPFYEQLQYAMDSRSVGLFHYLITGDDRLMRQTITLFASSVTSEGLTQSRFPSHTNQLIAAFPLFWILEVCDHHLYFGDTVFARSFLPRIDGVFDFFDTYIDERGLISGLPDDVWQFVDWVTTWGATDEYPDKGVPTAGRKSNLHTYFSMLLAFVLDQTALLVRNVGRPGYAEEYEARSRSLKEAIRKHCYDGHFFTDSTADIADASSYSQHCQIWAILSGTAMPAEYGHLLAESFAEGSGFSKASYMMMFYAFRAFAKAGDDLYERHWVRAMEPWQRMLACNLSTCEEDDVRQRSDCHAWSSVPIYEYCTELVGLRPIAPGAKKILFKPRVRLSPCLKAKVALGRDNVGTVTWQKDIGSGKQVVQLRLDKAVEVVSQLPGANSVDHGLVDSLWLSFAG